MPPAPHRLLLNPLWKGKGKFRWLVAVLEGLQKTHSKSCFKNPLAIHPKTPVISSPVFGRKTVSKTNVLETNCMASNYLQIFEQTLAEFRQKNDLWGKNVLDEQINLNKESRNLLLRFSLFSGGILGIVVPLLEKQELFSSTFLLIVAGLVFVFIFYYGLWKFECCLTEDERDLKETQNILNEVGYGEYLNELQQRIALVQNDVDYSKIHTEWIKKTEKNLATIPTRQRSKVNIKAWFLTGIILLLVNLFYPLKFRDADKWLLMKAQHFWQSVEKSIPEDANHKHGINPVVSLDAPAFSPPPLPSVNQPSPSPQSVTAPVALPSRKSPPEGQR